jgi:hypothetical protein
LSTGAVRDASSGCIESTGFIPADKIAIPISDLAQGAIGRACLHTVIAIASNRPCREAKTNATTIRSNKPFSLQIGRTLKIAGGQTKAVHAGIEALARAAASSTSILATFLVTANGETGRNILFAPSHIQRNRCGVFCRNVFIRTIGQHRVDSLGHIRCGYIFLRMHGVICVRRPFGRGVPIRTRDLIVYGPRHGV